MAASSSEEIEVNLTPLLDLVLQLIMFFMITIRLVHYETSNEDIDLPKTAMDLPQEDAKKKNRFPVWVNLSKDGDILGLEVRDSDGKVKPPMRVPIKRDETLDDYKMRTEEIHEVIKNYFSDKKERVYDRQARLMGLKEGEWKVGVVIRADRRCRYEQVYTIMDIVKEANFDFWQISIENLAGGS